MRRNIIHWRFWYNPFGDSDEEFISEEEAEENHPWDTLEEPRQIKVRPVIPTPMGLMPIQPFQDFSTAFQFWLGDTNFDITQDVKEKIEAIPGVEILDILTRYCFRIAIGKTFQSSEVKVQIQHALNADPPQKGEINPNNIRLDKTTQERVTLLQKTIKKQFPFWAIYVIPNGEIDVAGASTEEGYYKHFELYKQSQELAGGVIFQYV